LEGEERGTSRLTNFVPLKVMYNLRYLIKGKRKGRGKMTK